MSNYTPLWGTASAVMGVAALKKEVVEQLIPPDIALSAQDITPAGTHPVVFQLNKQKIRILLPFFTMNYYEFIPLIPHVHFKNAPDKPYQMSPILYVSSWLIVLGARIAWHLNKVWATFRMSPEVNNFFDSASLGTAIYRSGVEAVVISTQAQGQPGPETAFPNLEKIASMLNTDAIINSPDNQYWTASYRIEISKVQGITEDMQLHMPELPELSSLSFPSITDNVLGACKIDFSWKLAFPKKYNPH